VIFRKKRPAFYFLNELLPIAFGQAIERWHQVIVRQEPTVRQCLIDSTKPR